ncbi:hypothetical protein FBQ87_00490 [Sphingobacteriales bacterium CHB3]|nr:hypothetical protein [Sphingobacteriales bacterium CHB3]
MILIDENIISTECAKPKKWKSSVRQIGLDIGSKGMKDYEILPFLLQLRKLTFLTRDRDYYNHRLCHHRYCLAWFDVSAVQFSDYARLFLQHRAFRTQQQRLGKIVHISIGGITYWSLKSRVKRSLSWE